MSELIKVTNIEEQLVTTSGLALKDAKDLLEAYGMPLTETGKLLSEAELIEVTSEDDTDTMARAHAIRMELKATRIATKKRHDEIKEDVKKRGNAIDLVERTVRETLEPVEAKLLEAEKFAEVAEAKRKAERTQQRLTLMAEYTDNISIYNVEDLADDAFDLILDDLKAAKAARDAAEQARIKAEAKAEKDRQKQLEADRKAREKAETEAAELRKQREADEAKHQAELAAAKAEQDKKDAAARAEREALAAEQAKKEKEAADKLAIERAEREKLEQAERDRKAAEDAAKKAAEDEAAKAAAAPDKEKLLAHIDALYDMVMPSLATEQGKKIAVRIQNHISESTKTYRKLIESEL